jgi:hypothetical protein
LVQRPVGPAAGLSAFESESTILSSFPRRPPRGDECANGGIFDRLAAFENSTCAALSTAIQASESEQEGAMGRKSMSLTGSLLFIVLLASGSAAAGGGGRGGDSSMNPFTGDSYAYFHGGHNLGEEGSLIPWRTPAANPSANVSGKTSSKAPAAPTGAFRSTDPKPTDQRTDAERSPR